MHSMIYPGIAKNVQDVAELLRISTIGLRIVKSVPFVEKSGKMNTAGLKIVRSVQNAVE